MAAPTFIQEAETAWSVAAGATRVTGSFNVLAGDILVAIMLHEDQAKGGVLSASGGSLTWTTQQQVSVSDYSLCAIATAIVDADKSMTVTVTRTVAIDTEQWGVNCLTFRGASAVGASAKTNASGAPTLNLTTTQANSSIVVANADWNAVDGSSRTWRTNAGALTEQTYNRVSGRSTLYGGYHADAGAVSTYAVGLSAPSGQKYSIVAVEIKGSASGTLYTHTVAGVLTPVGSIVKRVSKNLSGVLTPVGTLRKVLSKVLSGVVSPTGVLVKRVNKVLSGVLTPVGTIAVALRKSTVVTGSLALSGALSKRVDKVLTGTVTPVGTVSKRVNKVLQGVLTPIGVVSKQVNKVLSAALSLVGSVVSVFVSGGGVVYTVSLNAALVLTGTLSKQVNKVLVGTVTPTGVLVKSIHKVLSGVLTPVGSIVNAARFSVVLTGVITPVGVLVKQVNKTLQGGLVVSGSIVKRVNKSLSGVLVPVGSLTKQVGKVLSGMLTPVGVLVRSYIRSITLSGALSMVGSLTSSFIAGSGVVLSTMLPWFRRKNRR